MCHNNNTATRNLLLSPNPSRKTRTNTRKPKFLSITREISPENTSNSCQMTHNHHHHQLNLFPLHPENLIEERDIHDENVSYFFDTDGNATLNCLLPTTSGVVSSDVDSLSPSLTYTYGAQDSDEGAISLARTALRHQERDTSEEKWVCYSEVVEEKKEDEVTSGSADVWCFKQSQGLSLKLDYQEILNAWSDKGPLYIEGEGPQIVPDVLDDSSTVLGDGGSAGIGRLWRVPDDGNSVMSDVGGGDSWKIGQREASVLRYKEKRQSRLFAKRIRYEVRKLNAEKRPRMKGRFVKRS